MQPLFLTGFMGAGKSAVGRRLADLLHIPFVDLDLKIEAEAGCTVTEIFSRFGEPHFRTLESQVLRRVAGQGGQVVATGGGVVIAADNRRVMRATGRVIHLKVSVDEVGRRLQGDTTRPLLRGEDPGARVRQLLAEREEFYADADLAVETTGRSIDEIVGEIACWLNSVGEC